MANYKLVKEDEEDITIEKSGFTYEFTKSSLIDNLRYIRKIKKEMTAQISLNKAEMENIVHFHPFINDMTEEDLQVAFLYERSLATKNEAEKKLEQANEAEAEELDTIAKIKEQLDIEIEVPEDLKIELK
jgi:hypothetical protein